MRRTPRSWRAGAALLIAAAVGVGAAWGVQAMRPRELPLEPDASGGVRMPDVVMTDLDRTGRRLEAAGFRVTVRRPAASFTPSGSERALTLPELVRPFAAGEWNHLVAGQEPGPGASLRPGAAVTLVAGVHHGAGPFRPWLGTHSTAVAIRGEGRCRDCHAPTYCSDCHERWSAPTR